MLQIPISAIYTQSWKLRSALVKVPEQSARIQTNARPLQGICPNLHTHCVFSLLLCVCAEGNGCREKSALGLVSSAPATVEYSAKSRPHMWWITAGCRQQQQQKPRFAWHKHPHWWQMRSSFWLGWKAEEMSRVSGMDVIVFLLWVPFLLCVSFLAETLAEHTHAFTSSVHRNAHSLSRRIILHVRSCFWRFASALLNCESHSWANI